MIQKKLYRFYEILKSRDVLSKLDELERNQWLSKRELENIQKKKLTKVVNESITNVPYYQEIYKKHSVEINDKNIVEMLQSFPILTKQDINKNYEKLINSRYKGRSHVKFSGGSSGIPVKLLQDQNSYDFASAAAKRSDRWAGWDFNSSVFQFWGAPRDLRGGCKEKIKKYLLQSYIFDTFNWNEDTIIYIYKLMERVKPDIIVSYSSALYFYVKTLKEKGFKANHYPKGIITSADMLYDYQREQIEDYFATKVFNRYGCREVGLIACECEEHNGLHISSDRLYVEIVDENNNPVPKGELGKIIITDLTNIAMPLLRYEIGDMGQLSIEENCSCGRNLPKLASIQGRISDYIITETGDHIRVPAYIVNTIGNVKQMQLVQKDYNNITIRIVKDDGYDIKNEKKVINELSKYMDTDMVYDFEYVDSLINKVSGKFRFIINDMTGDK